ncbi:GrpB family protein [Staphylococcus americanisciuri]|uniref:GrpB family protein n=1 Tax=Staphylococcus americanisciuri TaxID=2973940 RepID=A0ABT2F1T3_9STAP|nr:GrpB family protein [Staphylococcus americanisciuri]MCS4486406.1 GrpB family protein [Staphylococcus americanisciuri]
MYPHVQPFITQPSKKFYTQQYLHYRTLLYELLDSPVKSTQHIGGTQHFNYPTEPILDILVGVDNLHDITSLDEKRLNYAGFYRLHHPYHKKVMMARFNNLTELKQQVRLHILQRNTPLFEHYLALNQLLTESADAIAFFADQKQALLASSQTIRDYEAGKTQLFTQLNKFL